MRSAPPQFASPWPPPLAGPRPSIVLTVTGDATEYGWPRDLGPILQSWGAACERAYRESALFTDVSVGRGRGQARVDIALHADLQQNDGLTFLSYLTLLVIPSYDTTEISMVTQVTSADGQALGTVETRGRSRTWYELLLFPFSSFYEPRAVTPNIIYDMSREAITTLHDRGVF